MAAADYYNPGGQQPTAPHPAPAVQGHLNPNPPYNPPYPLSDLPPPPYSQFADQQRPHSQPPPQHRPPMNNQFNPGQPSNYPPQNHMPPNNNAKPPLPINSMYKPSDFGGPYTPQPYQQNVQPNPYQQAPGYFPLAGTPAMQQVYGNGNNGGRRPSTTPSSRPPRKESRSRSRSRSRDRSRSRHRKHRHRPEGERKKSSGMNTFLGAGGGAIIGDAIFPGLGTLGGALIGGLGGHEYGKKRPASNPSRARRSYDDSYIDDYRRGRK